MVKSATFGVMHLGIAFGVSYALTGSVAIAGAITLVEPLVNTVAHYFFDRLVGKTNAAPAGGGGSVESAPSMLHPQPFDVIVIGGGHAGTEAALAAARMGCATLLLTHNIETLGQMSCNPSIGGIGKGHLVKEVDALGGAMAAATDEAGIQFRILNGSKGPAVRATRAQADRVLYKAAIRRRLENQPNLWLFQQAVDDLMRGGRPGGRAPSRRPACASAARAVVLTAGTFLDGRIHVGPAELQRRPGGRPAGAERCRRG